MCCILSCIWTRLHLTCIRPGPLSTWSQYGSSYFVKFSQRKCRRDEYTPTKSGRRPSASSGSNTSTIGSALLVSRDDNDRGVAEISGDYEVGDRGDIKSRNSGWFACCTRRGYVARVTSPPLLEHEDVHFYPIPSNISPTSGKLNNYEPSQRDTHEGSFFSRGIKCIRILRIEYLQCDSLRKRRDQGTARSMGYRAGTSYSCSPILCVRT